MTGLIYSTQLLLGAAGGGDPAQGLISFMPLIIIFVIFYFLLIRPQKKKQQEHKQMLDNLKRGDRVMTTGGIYGTIEGLTDTTLQLKIANQVKITIARSAIAGLQKGDVSEENQ
ncbi:MAG: preprotein translocase subunit YajC [Candidatus Vecturithrix sp.]|nr:preprotein translocase subunit YajC [Candidatus Vecturithrix sp.]